VYAYLQAMRSLKRARVTPEDVAAALGISVASALEALTALHSRAGQTLKMSEHVRIPVREYGREKWGWLSALCPDHEIVGYDFKMVDQNYSFVGGHRVRLYKIKGNVHFKIPSGIEFDISAVAPAAPRRQDRRHHKK
jgi:hypothetical protein